MEGRAIESERLLLRSLLDSDAERIFELINDFDIVKNLTAVPWPYRRHMAEEFLRDTEQRAKEASAIRRAITIKPSQDLVGIIDMRFRAPRIGVFGYWLGKPHWGHGYVTEALEAFVAYAFDDLGMERVNANALPENAASLKVMAKNGFTPGEVMRHWRPSFRDFVELQDMWLDRAEWEALRT